MVFRVFLTGADGSEWPLVAEEHRGVFLEEGLWEGLLGTMEANATAGVFGVAGQVVQRGGRVPSMSGTLRCVVDDSRGAVWRTFGEFRRAWSTVSAAVLSVVDEAGQRFFAECRLAAPIAPLSQVDREWGFERFSVQVVVDSGVWRSPVVVPGGGAVTVTNWGDVNVWPKIEWSGAGGAVVVPSGARFTLPRVSAPRTVDLNPTTGCVVTDLEGRVDRAAWVGLRTAIFPEEIPPGETRRFTLPAGALLHADVGVFDPLRGS